MKFDFSGVILAFNKEYIYKELSLFNMIIPKKARSQLIEGGALN